MPSSHRVPGPAEFAREICEGTRGVDWDAERVDAAVKALLKCRTAPTSDLAEALDALVQRLESSRLEDHDGIAHVAITAGTLVEYGQSPERLGEALLAKLPGVLRGVRRCADRCFADFPSFESEDDEEKYLEPLWADALAQVDNKPISRSMIRAALDHDRTGAVALAYLEQWTLATVAAVSRSARLRARAAENAELLELTAKLRHSTAGWLYDLFRTETDAPWLVLCPTEMRGFMLRVDGVSSNFNLHETVSDVLIHAGIPGTGNPPDVIAYLRGEIERPSAKSCVGSFNFYDYRAASVDITDGHAVDTDHWVWNEGSTSDVPTWNGEKILIAGPAAYERSWNLSRRFSALPVSATLERELSPEEFRSKLDQLKRSNDK